MEEQNHIQLIASLCTSVGRLEGKVDGINNRLDKSNGALKSHDERLDSDEKEIANLKTKAMIYGAIAGSIISFLLVLLAHYLFKFY